MIPTAMGLLVSIAAGILGGLSVYRYVMVSDLVLRMKKTQMFTTRRTGRLADFAWGKGHLDVWEELHLVPLSMYQLAAMTAAGFTILMLAFGVPLWLAWIFAVPGIFMGPRVHTKLRARQRRRQILAGLPDALGPVLESLRLTQSAIDTVRAAIPYTEESSPIREEFERIVAEAVAKRDFPGALQRFAKRVGDPVAYDFAQVLTVGFHRRSDPHALVNVRGRVVATRTLAIEKAIQNVPSYMVGTIMCVFLAFAALGSVVAYQMFIQQAGGIPTP